MTEFTPLQSLLGGGAAMALAGMRGICG